MSEWLELEPYDRYIPWRDGMNNETALHELLNSLKDGEHVKATWVHYDYTIAVEGPVRICDGVVRCERYIRLDDGAINNSLASLEVVRDQKVTATREDEKSLYSLVDSLEDGWEVTAEYLDEVEEWLITLSGSVVVDGAYKYVLGDERTPLRWSDGILHVKLHSVTATRPVVYRWKREGNA